MSRIYILDDADIAIAAARMKADANFIGLAGEVVRRRLKDNHVFIQEAWEQGGLTIRRLQSLYHRLSEGDILFVHDQVPEALLHKAVSYAKERGTRVVFVQHSMQEMTCDCCEWADIALLRTENSAVEKTESPAAIWLLPHEHAAAYAGALALCLMNRFVLDKADLFCRRASMHKELPWYDEIAY
ncbi:hypothetical protein RE628_18710 [Paenibacillus sp. D2_2]|uniref:hypothetical protein n=1 Tax=Paenibacillus sp. D2_2 TaxID=3073092 RepID=UPI00281663C1|nr:hypothetical protein [Paenibacillus sp. D2_2]WMT39446.1 hypothetical protein RE628_18710 [Paenibacillus sp. D2_2]